MPYYIRAFGDDTDAALADAQAAQTSGGVLGVSTAGATTTTAPPASSLSAGVITLGLLATFVVAVGLIFGSARR